MNDFKKVLLDKGTRKYIYGICVGLVALAVFYGYFTGEESLLWLALVAAALQLSVSGSHMVDDDKIVAQKVENAEKKEDKKTSLGS